MYNTFSLFIIFFSSNLFIFQKKIILELEIN